MARIIPFTTATTARRNQQSAAASAFERVALGNKMQLLANIHPQSLKVVERYVDRLLVAHGATPVAPIYGAMTVAPSRTREEP